ncbi:single-stranded DNA-binding protein [bacterium]|nr:single-stranded DNA-binding protein [candidate division CSSED10-310 bacterium]
MNVVFLIGRLGADPEIRFLPSGAQIAKMRLAVSDRWTDKASGQRQEKTHWIGLTAFGKTADVISRYVKKGHKIAIRGALEYREWTDNRDGGKRSMLEVKVMELEMLTPRGDSGPGPHAGEAPPSYEPQNYGYDETSIEDDGGGEDEIPF